VGWAIMWSRKRIFLPGRSVPLRRLTGAFGAALAPILTYLHISIPFSFSRKTLILHTFMQFRGD
jgi:hypothetical protein